ncbi:unnamed protein product [Adineta steineri]|uniref:Uncharacterized protein n=1 Tax=Adineta steineri TaxID=433720 RepID=A0A818JXZ9_9BILA|nr:unnamed protein product [Adineta steineri]CAF3548202.1 unnamed protein product [Adineta steineri]
MSHRIESSTSWARHTSSSTISSISTQNSKVTMIIWIYRIILLFILLLFVIPFALLLTPWWIWMQPFEKICPNIMNGYYRLVTWPLTISKNIRFYRTDDHFIEKLKY